MPIDYEAGRVLLERVFVDAQNDLLSGVAPEIPEPLSSPFDLIFSSATQAYREALVGCTIARIQDNTINIRLPYIKQGANAYNGRSLDEAAVNPFLQSHRVPSSKGPFLSALRRGIQFDEGTTRGLRDVNAYRAFLALLTYLEATTTRHSLNQFLRYLLYRFAKLREAADIRLSRLQRVSLEQYDSLIASLLATPSGGRLPVMVVVAAFRSIKEYYNLSWIIDHQEINVADSQTGVGGDITITSEGKIVLAVEITERPLDRARVISTFNTKIAPHGIEDYLFFVRPEALAGDARRQARQYFAQGHEVNFIEIKDWVLMAIATMGRRGRELFNVNLLELMNGPSIPRSVKVAWNEYLSGLTTSTED